MDDQRLKEIRERLEKAAEDLDAGYSGWGRFRESIANIKKLEG